jgi:hypothetical protein
MGVSSLRAAMIVGPILSAPQLAIVVLGVDTS